MTSPTNKEDNSSSADYRPHEPSCYAPNTWRDRLRPLSSPLSPTLFTKPPTAEASRPVKAASGAADSLDGLEAQLEDAVFEALRRPQGPVVMSASLGFLHELDRRIALISIAGRIALAVGISAIVALFLVFMVPASPDDTARTDGVSSGGVPTTRTAVSEPNASTDDLRPGICELPTIAGPNQIQPAVTHERSGALLQQFIQWRESRPDQRAPINPP